MELVSALSIITSGSCTNAQRIQVEGYIVSSQNSPGFFSSLINILIDETISTPVRQMAGSIIKNTIRRRWSCREGPDALSNAERDHYYSKIITAVTSPVLEVRKIAASSLMILNDVEPKTLEIIPNLCALFKGNPVQIAGALLTIQNILLGGNVDNVLVYFNDLSNALLELCNTTNQKSIAAGCIDCFKKLFFDSIMSLELDARMTSLIKESYMKWHGIIIRAIDNFVNELQHHDPNEIDLGMTIPYLLGMTFSCNDEVNCLFAYNSASVLQQVIQFKANFIPNLSEIYSLCINVLKRLVTFPSNTQSVGLLAFYRMIMTIIEKVYNPMDPNCGNIVELLNLIVHSMLFTTNLEIDDPSLIELFLSDTLYRDTNVRSTATQTLVKIVDKSLKCTSQVILTLIALVERQMTAILATKNYESFNTPEAEVCIFIMENIIGIVNTSEFGQDDQYGDDGDMFDDFGDEFDDESYSEGDNFSRTNKSPNNCCNNKMDIKEKISPGCSPNEMFPNGVVSESELDTAFESVKNFVIKLSNEVILPVLENPPLKIAPLFVSRCLKVIGLFSVWLDQETCVKVLRILISAACQQNVPMLIRMSATSSITEMIINDKNKVEDEIRRNSANLLLGMIPMLNPDTGMELTEDNLYSVLDTITEIVVDAFKTEPNIISHVIPTFYELFITQILDPFAVEQITDIFSLIAEISPEMARNIRSMILVPSFSRIKEQLDKTAAISSLITLCSRVVIKPRKEQLNNNMLTQDELGIMVSMLILCKDINDSDVICSCCDLFTSILFSTDMNLLKTPLTIASGIVPIVFIKNYIISIFSGDNEYSSIDSASSFVGAFFSKYGMSFDEIPTVFANCIIEMLDKHYKEFSDPNSRIVMRVPVTPIITCLSRICVSVGAEVFKQLILRDGIGEALKKYMIGLVNTTLGLVNRKDRLRAMLSTINLVRSLPDNVLTTPLPLRMVGQWTLTTKGGNKNKKSSGKSVSSSPSFNRDSVRGTREDSIPIQMVPFMALAMKLLLRVVDIDIYCDNISLKYLKGGSSQNVTCQEASYITGNTGGSDEYYGELGIVDTDSKSVYKKFISQLNQESRNIVMQIYDNDELELFKKFTM